MTDDALWYSTCAPNTSYRGRKNAGVCYLFGRDSTADLFYLVKTIAPKEVHTLANVSVNVNVNVNVIVHACICVRVPVQV